MSLQCAVMTAGGELTGIFPVSVEPLEGRKVCADLAGTARKFVICDESISDGSLVLRGSQRFFFFLG